MDARERILHIAEEMFAKKGYDGTSVNEIAKEAEVNKALIYYYFESKKDLLNTLFFEFVKLIEKEITYLYNEKNDEMSMRHIEKSSLLMVDFVVRKKKLIKIAVIESLKEGEEDNIIIALSDMLMANEIESIRERYKQKGWNIEKDEKLLMVTEFFTGIMPILTFAIFGDVFGEKHELSKAQMKEMFVQAFLNTHIEYHKNKL